MNGRRRGRPPTRGDDLVPTAALPQPQQQEEGDNQHLPSQQYPQHQALHTTRLSPEEDPQLPLEIDTSSSDMLTSTSTTHQTTTSQSPKGLHHRHARTTTDASSQSPYRSSTTSNHHRYPPPYNNNGGDDTLLLPFHHDPTTATVTTLTPSRRIFRPHPHPHHHPQAYHNHNINATNGHINTTARKPRQSWLRLCFFLGTGCYLILILQTLSLFFSKQQQPSAKQEPQESAFSKQWSRQLDQQHQNYHYHSSASDLQQPHDNDRYPNFEQSTLYQQRRRAELRRAQTRPAKADVVEWYHRSFVDHYHDSSQKNLPSSQSQLDDNLNLCGDAVRQLFTDGDPFIQPHNAAALNQDSRVLITGVLSALGIQLAVTLHHNCGVQVMFGTDSMYPNTSLDRLDVAKRLSFLETSIPQFTMVPTYIGLDPEQKQKQQKSSAAFIWNHNNPGTDEWNVLSSISPTHIILLEGYQERSTTTDNRNADDGSLEQPLPLKPFYQLQNRLISMEQTFQSIRFASATDEDVYNLNHPDRSDSVVAPPPQVLYVGGSSSTSSLSSSLLHSTSLELNGLMASIYFQEFGISSIGMNLPSAIFGAWDSIGNAWHEIVDYSIDAYWKKTTSSEASAVPRPDFIDKGSTMEWLYVDDAVEAMIMHLQYKPPLHRPTTVTLSGTSASATDVTQMIRSLSPTADTKIQANSIDWSQFRPQSSAAKNSDIVPLTSFREELIQSISWSLNQQKDIIESGDQFRRRHEAPVCSPEDLICEMDGKPLPCISACNRHEECLPSIFDSTRDLVADITEGCDIVLYTQSLGYNVKNLDLHSQFMDESELDDDGKLICNFAFVPRQSDLVSSVINKVPTKQVLKFGVQPKEGSEDHDDWNRRRLDGLNGRLLYRGWILIWVPDAVEPITVQDEWLLKMSPDKLFHGDVKKAFFVDENFPTSPNIEDVLFLSSQLERSPVQKRWVRGKVELPDGKTKPLQFWMPPQPAQRAVILFPPLRKPEKSTSKTSSRKALSIHTAAKYMRYEVDLRLLDEPDSVRKQRGFYERINRWQNSNSMRSPYEPRYGLKFRHYVRSRWVLHDLEVDLGRDLRCEWYQEHIRWGTKIDQLSFAYVMARWELERRIGKAEPDDSIPSYFQRFPEQLHFTDWNEWYPLEVSNELVPVLSDEQDDDAVDEKPEHVGVRIMSERVMSATRKIWTRQQKMQKKVA